MQNEIVRTSVIGYSTLLALSLGTLYWRGRLVELFAFPGWGRLLEGILTGCVLAGTALIGFEALRRTFDWAAALDREFRVLLRPLRLHGAIVVALLSGVGEEVFFRGLVQPALGIWITSILFGAMHFPVNRRLIPWTALAVVMGLGFGVVYEATGSLLSVIAAHVTINLAGLLEVVYEKESPDRFG